MNNNNNYNLLQNMWNTFSVYRRIN